MIDSADPAIEASALTKRYPGGILALKGIDLRIARGSVTALIGANGSGKSTLLQILAGVVPADAGSVRVLGADPRWRPAVLRARTGYIAQGVELDPEMSGAETLWLFANLYGMAPHRARSRIAELAAVFGLESHLPRRVRTYSGGLRQRLHIAVGFVHDPELVLMDEPSAALDPAGRAGLRQFVGRLRDRGNTVVLVTHDTSDASRHGDDVILMHQGCVVGTGPPQALVAQHAHWMLEVRFARPVDNDPGWLAGIDLPVKRARLAARGKRLIVHFAATDAGAALDTKRRVLERLEAAGEPVLSFTLDPPDLAGAYFELTGAAITGSARPAAQRRAGSGGQVKGMDQAAAVE